MADLPHPWGVYARLQAMLARRYQADDQSWGLDAGLDRLLTAQNKPPGEEEADRAVRSENRRERYRAQLRRVHLVLEDRMADPEEVVAARRALRAAQMMVSHEDWALLCAVGEGHEYAEIAAAQGVSVGQLRIRVLRLRRRLAGPASGMKTNLHQKMGNNSPAARR